MKSWKVFVKKYCLQPAKIRLSVQILLHLFIVLFTFIYQGMVVYIIESFSHRLTPANQRLTYIFLRFGQPEMEVCKP